MRGPHRGFDLRRYRAERLLRKDFAGLRSKVLAIVRSRLRTKGVALDASDLEACYALAWHGLYATVLDGEQIENPSAWLVLVTFRRAIDESRATSRVGLDTEADGTGALQRQVGASNPDLAAELDDRARLRQLFEGMRSSLSERECQAASLCYLQGLSRADAAERMGISEARMRKLMEGAGPGRPGVAGKLGSLLDTIKAGGWCERQSSLMRAFAFGILDPEGERHALAVAHCRECPACRAHVASLRGLASVLPLPLLSPLALAGGTATSASGAGGSATGAGGATAGGTPSATRLPANGLHLGGRASGWSGFAGSLTAKLAVIAAILLGAGYAVFGSRAHGSPSAARPPAVPASVAGETAPLPAFSARARRSHPIRRSPTTKPGSSRTRTARSTSEASGREFLPERLKDGVPVVSSTATPARSRNSTRAAREFGIE
jgi:DNA-directed RNA polymerase specialized sigma24 family protein